MRNILLFAAIACGGCASYAKHAETINATGYLVANALIMCDYGQTTWASNGGQWDRQVPGHPDMVYAEMNPLLGHHPSPEMLGAVIVTDIVINTAVEFSPLPNWFKSAWFGTVVTAETYMVTTNNFHGVCGADL